MEPLWFWIVKIIVAAAIVYVIFAAIKRRRRGIMHDRNALARRFKTTTDDIVEIENHANE
jgi:hypothetical protein